MSLVPLWAAAPAIALLLVLPSPTHALDLRDPAFMEKVQPAFDAIFNLNYGKAEQLFMTLRQEYPAHPAPPLYLAAILWLRELARHQDLDLDKFVSPGYFMKAKEPVAAADQKAFFDFIQQSETLSKSILARNPADRDGQYFLAAAYGIRGSWIFTIDHSLTSAFGFGKKAYQIDRGIIQQDPKYHDAYMTVGIYEYIVGSIPWYIKWLLSIFGFQGSKERGFQYLDLATQKGIYVLREAQVVRSVLLVREGRYAEALNQIEALQRRFPRNYLFQLNGAQILERVGKREEAIRAYQEVPEEVDTGRVTLGDLPLGVLRYEVGWKIMQLGRRDLAEEQFQKAIGDPETPERERALSHLRLGQILDSQGKRAQAVRQYQAVLSSPSFDNSHQTARELLKAPSP